MKRAFFTANRRRLSDVLTPDGPVILTAYDAMQRRSDMSASFEQEANFWYLTGIDAPGWQLVMTGEKSILIAPEVDDIHQVFDGSLSWERAREISGVDQVISASEGRDVVVNLAAKHEGVHTLGRDPRAAHYDFALNPAPGRLLRQLKKQFNTVTDVRLDLARLRAIKQPAEIEAIERAIEATIAAFKDVKNRLSDFNHEYEVEAAFSHNFRSKGLKGHAYEPIVAGGLHACTLHYVDNDGPLQNNSLLLIDIGASADGYAADITRTYAIGTPTKRQRAIHAAVEAAHHEIIGLLKPGLLVTDYHQRVDEIMKRALDGLGLLKKPEEYRTYFPHAISHGLGIDVHDSLGRPETFEAGMVLTVEPGIYIPEESIGVRIEDDILITPFGHRNLSAGLPTSL